MKIFLAATSLRTSYGGPAYSVARLANALTDAGHSVGLWSADGSRSTLDLRCRLLSGGLHEILGEFGPPDVIHDNGLWLKHNHSLARAATRLGVARVVSTRGMLEPWARNHKRLRKRIAWQFYQRRDLACASRIHTTSAVEAANVVALNLGVDVCVIPNGVDLPPSSVAQRSSGTNRIRRALVLGRYHPIKGLPMLIDAWASARPEGWHLQIAGPDEGGHRSVVEAALKSAGLEREVTLSGAVQGEEKRKLFQSADLFILPSHSESFGMSVAEALSYGIPVLATTGAPWPMLEEKGCGWLCAPASSEIANRLRDATSSDDAKLQDMGQRGRAYVEAELAWNRIAQEFSRLYSDAIDSSGRS